MTNQDKMKLRETIAFILVGIIGEKKLCYEILRVVNFLHYCTEFVRSMAM